MKKKQIIRIAQLTLLAAAALTLTASADAKNRPKKIIVVRTMDLPELARVPGEAMILQATGDGKTHLYVRKVSRFSNMRELRFQLESPRIRSRAECSSNSGTHWQQRSSNSETPNLQTISQSRNCF